MTRWDLLAGVGLDLALGDPRWFPHPVRGIGWLIGRGEQILGPSRLSGLVLCVSVVCVSTAIVWVTLPWANVYWIYSFLALRSLDVESSAVVRSLRDGDLPQARANLAMVVGRDTERLDEAGILRGAIETVAENVNDGVIAPLFYLALFGPAGMAAYKAVNTLDSMVGYKDERYRDLGWASARLDDILNFIPARLSAVLIWAAAALLAAYGRSFVGRPILAAAGLPAGSVWRSIRVTLRDGGSQPSPNSGWPEAAFAGAMGIQIGGLNYYRGVPSRKAHLGDATRPITVNVFHEARLLLYVSSLLMVALVFAWLEFAWI